MVKQRRDKEEEQEKEDTWEAVERVGGRGRDVRGTTTTWWWQHSGGAATPWC